MTIGPGEAQRSPGPHDGRRDPSELINRAERSPLKWNLDKFSMLMLPGRYSMWALSLRPLKEERKRRRGGGRGRMRVIQRLHENRRTCYQRNSGWDLGQLSCRRDSCSVSSVRVSPSSFLLNLGHRTWSHPPSRVAFTVQRVESTWFSIERAGLLNLDV